MIIHLVSFRWKPETSADDIARISAALATLPDIVPTINTFHFGADVRANAGSTNMDFAVFATFDSLDDWRVYDKDPEHGRIRSEVIGPWIAERAAVQFES